MFYAKQATDKLGRTSDKFFNLANRKFESAVALYTNSPKVLLEWGRMLFQRFKKRKKIFKEELLDIPLEREVTLRFSMSGDLRSSQHKLASTVSLKQHDIGAHYELAMVLLERLKWNFKWNFVSPELHKEINFLTGIQRKRTKLAHELYKNRRG